MCDKIVYVLEGSMKKARWSRDTVKAAHIEVKMAWHKHTRSFFHALSPPLQTALSGERPMYRNVQNVVWNANAEIMT